MLFFKCWNEMVDLFGWWREAQPIKIEHWMEVAEAASGSQLMKLIDGASAGAATSEALLVSFSSLLVQSTFSSSTHKPKNELVCVGWLKKSFLFFELAGYGPEAPLPRPAIQLNSPWIELSSCLASFLFMKRRKEIEFDLLMKENWMMSEEIDWWERVGAETHNQSLRN